MNKTIIIFYILILNSCSPHFKDRPFGLFKENVINGLEVKSEDPIALSTVGLFNTKKNSICSGTLIAPHFILTAAHCAPERASHLKIVFSTNIDYTINAREQDVLQELVLSVVNFKTAPNWNPLDEEIEENTGDIALVEFNGEIPEHYKIATFLPEGGPLAVGDLVTVAGHGYSSVITKAVDEKQYPNLQKAIEEGEIVCKEDEKSKPYQCVSVEMSGESILRKAVAPISKILETEIILDERKAGTCNGDSGGPAFILKDGRYYLLGVTSRGSELCNESGAYTNILKYKKWIEEIINSKK